ncbi:sentrin-specific protease 2 [Drosophila busckii]|nr:sentrin-specific protease 2 [Drosophila busckii]XP_017852417.1 sentrin-specific protease 2 [Drosophila busckii]
MGFDLFNRIRHWFLLGGQSGAKDPHNNAATSDKTNRKRRFTNFENDNTAPRLIKYRRVHNSFPKFITNEAEDYGDMTDTSKRPEQQLPQSTQSAAGYQTQTQKRLTMFNAPQIKQLRVLYNPATVTLDLSDGDDENTSPLPQEKQQSNKSHMYSGFNHIMRAGVDTTTSTQRERSSAASTRPNLLYSEALRYGTNGFASDSTPSSISPVHSEPRLMNGHDTSSGNSNANANANANVNDNVILLEDQRNEHNQYVHLINNLSLEDRELPNQRAGPTTIETKATEPPPLRPPPPMRFNMNGDEWLRGLMKPSPAVHNERSEYAKFLKTKEAPQAQLQPPPPPPLLRYNSKDNTMGSIISLSSLDNSSRATNAMDDSKLKTRNPSMTGAKTASLSGQRPLTKALQMRYSTSIYFADNFTELFKDKCARVQQQSVREKQHALENAEKSSQERWDIERKLRESMSKRRYLPQTLFVLDKYQSGKQQQEQCEPQVFALTGEQQQLYNQIIQGPGHQVLVSKFSLNITRNDISTLIGSNWLNDEVINFYMNLLTDRSQQKEGQLPSVYAMNTFFVPRLLQTGHGGVRRWTRKVDIFSKDIIPVPVHVGGVHWCMAIIHMKNKTIRYYDSMGKPNHEVLQALECYLREESLDKRKIPFDTSGFTVENVPNVPQQTNGSDCGVFSCMFAEFITRNKPLNFSQQHMEFFRKKMVLEICGGELWM